MNAKVSRAAAALVESYEGGGEKIHHLDRRPLPSRDEAVAVLDALQELMFPGYTGAQGLTGAGLRLHVEARVSSPQTSQVLAGEVTRLRREVNERDARIEHELVGAHARRRRDQGIDRRLPDRRAGGRRVRLDRQFRRGHE